MLIDTRQFGQPSLSSDVCIVGAGPAGITLALQLAAQGIGVTLIESGGLEAERMTVGLNRGHNLGLPYPLGPGNRSRHLGGSSNCWGGFTQPFQAWDHDDRPWIPDSGWPFPCETLAPYRARVENLLRIDPQQYDPRWWAERLHGPDLERFPLDPQHLTDAMSALTPLRFGDYWREALTQSRRIQVLLWANAVEIEADRPATHVTGIRVRTLNGQETRVLARRFVLAAGGIETPRLLLASRRSMPEGLGNGQGLVGRYFMDHPRIYWGRVNFRDAWRGHRLYDIKFNYIRTPIRIGPAQGSGVLKLPYEVQRRERLGNSQVWLRSVFFGESTRINMALQRMQQRLPNGRRPGFGLVRDAATLLGQPLASCTTALGHLTCSRAFVSHVALEGIFEPEPNPNSRISLASDLDAVGMPRVQIDWRLTPNDWRSMDRTMNLVADELERQEIADIDREPSLAEGDFPVEATWHPLGTTRMHASPRRGVVDADCRVHGLTNLFVAGASVFPTAGANHPTMQLLALTYRLGEHLISGHGQPDAQTGTGWRRRAVGDGPVQETSIAEARTAATDESPAGPSETTVTGAPGAATGPADPTPDNSGNGRPDRHDSQALG